MLPAPFRADASVVNVVASRPAAPESKPVFAAPAAGVGADSVEQAPSPAKLEPSLQPDRRRRQLARPEPVAAPDRAVEEPAPEEPEASQTPKAQSIAGEIAEIDRIRGELRDGQAARALAALERYFRSSPTRVLQTEASLLRIDALVALGERERAGALAREFIARQPTSRYAERLRQLAGN